MSSPSEERKIFILLMILLIGVVLGASLILSTMLNVSWAAPSTPQTESGIVSTINRIAESYGLSMCRSIPVDISYPNAINAVLVSYGLDCGAYPLGSRLEVLIISFADQNDADAAAERISLQLTESRARGIVLVETSDSLVIMRGPASQSIQNRITGNTPN